MAKAKCVPALPAAIAAPVYKKVMFSVGCEINGRHHAA